MKEDRKKPLALTVMAIVLALIGLYLAVRGVELVTLGGSLYYVLAGLGLLGTGILWLPRKQATQRSQTIGLILFGITTLGTLVWALAEVGLRFWPLVPRLAPFLVLAFFVALLVPCIRGRQARKPAFMVAGLLAVLMAAGFASMFQPHGVIKAADVSQTPAADAGAAAADQPWQHYGRTPAGTRFAPFTQITKANVGQLEQAWVYRTGEQPGKGLENQNTPIQVGDSVYICTPLNRVIALDSATGQERWTFDPKIETNGFWNRCRGVGYYESDIVKQQAASTGQPQACAARIILTTNDARMIALDAATGQPCTAFGDNGTASLAVHIGDIKPSYYMQTSQPTVVDGLVVVGGWVRDGRDTDEPSGVVRAFSAETGELAWAWDLGNPDITQLPPEGQNYTRGTPNMWSTPAFDETLGLVYLPLGNATPDFWGGHRTEVMNKYTDTVVAVDIKTGREKWHYQFTRNDVWDYDVGSQPALYDMPDGSGGVVPALIQTTKTGQVFVLDRRTGTPLKKVEDRPVPQAYEPGDLPASPTQPYSVEMPSFGAKADNSALQESDMWGATFFDQLSCRIAFRKLNYQGEFTRVLSGDKPTLIYPGFYGGMNWGGNAIDEQRGLLILNDIRMPQLAMSVPLAQATPEFARKLGWDGGVHPQEGTPFASVRSGFYSPVGVPCMAPPWGTMSAVDIQTGKLLWQRPLGTVEDSVLPNGIRAMLPIPLGMPTLGGPIATATGVTFYTGTQDYYLRAFDSDTGEELWKGRLPVGSQSTPMTYLTQAGDQMVAVVAGGARSSPDRGDYVVAYRLKK